FSGFYTPPEQGGDKLLVSIVDSIPACHAGDRGSIPRRGDSACPFIFLRPWVESKKGQEESYLHWPGIEPHTKDKRACKVPPRFELGSLNSESRVLTITPWNHGQKGSDVRQVPLDLYICLCSFWVSSKVF